MNTYLSNYLTQDCNCNLIEEVGEFAKVAEITKRKHQTAVYKKSVDWTQSNYYIINDIVWEESTVWKNTQLSGVGSARNTGKTVLEYFGESIYNYIIK